MKYIVVFALAVLSFGGLTACTHWHNPHNGNFCPPGQAKKGNC